MGTALPPGWAWSAASTRPADDRGCCLQMLNDLLNLAGAKHESSVQQHQHSYVLLTQCSELYVVCCS